MIAKALQYTIYDILAYVSRETVWQKKPNVSRETLNYFGNE